MKLLIFLMVLTGIALSQQTCTDQLYKQYLAGYSKPEPADAQTWANKKARFCEVLNKIEQTNQKNGSYTLAINKFSDLLEDQLKKITSAIINPETLAQKGPQANLQRVGVNAGSINWYTAGKVTQIKDQGSCGSCWAFTVTGLYESFLAVQGASLFDLSEEYILQCTTQYTHNVYQSDCQGGYVDDSGNLAKDYGIPLESTYPYINGNYVYNEKTTPGICNAKKTVMYNADPCATSYLYYRNVSDSQLKTLLNQSPVGVLIYADWWGFMYYSSGVYDGCPSNSVSQYLLNHAVVLIGYDSNGNWIIKNQWGTGWGQSGFATISKDWNCGLNGWVYQYYSSKSYSGNTDYTVPSSPATCYQTSNNSTSNVTKYENKYTPMLLLVLLLTMSII